jgi:NhaP-type Na+/H+ or K+/H+ antiporter
MMAGRAGRRPPGCSGGQIVYSNIAILASLAFLYAIVSARVDRSWLSGPILFVAAGFLLGPAVLGVVEINIQADGLRLLAELTLAMVLFADAANANRSRILKRPGVMERLLLIGLPLTILLGFAVAWALFPGLGLIELGLIAATLAPTDAALGKPVVTNPGVPGDIREALNFESGLNDGICVPVVVLLVTLAIGTEIEGTTATHALRIVVEELGIGLGAGVAISLMASIILHHAFAARWVGEDWYDVIVVAIAVACFMAAQALGGSGFVACFAGGLVFSAPKGVKHVLLRGAEGAGSALALMTWIVFGAGVVWQMSDRITGASILYAALSLTLVRMLPVYLSLTGSSLSSADRLFVGWFGPRGLASIVFGIIVLDADLDGADTVLATIVCTVLLSVVAHGVTANPLIQAFSRRWKDG